MSWYEDNIEENIREITYQLRNEGINTFCSCGHGMWIQCETYDTERDLDTIYNALVSMGIKNYRAVVNDFIENGSRKKFIEISFPVNGNYYWITADNPEFKENVKSH